jgi:nitroreductase
MDITFTRILELINNADVVWGIPKNENAPAVLITAYRPNSTQWSEDYKKRLK